MDYQELDVRYLSPNERSKVIYKHLDKLTDGDSLRVTFNHNPSPLIGLINRERKGFYSHKLIEEGPVIWRIDFTKKSLDSIMESNGFNKIEIKSNKILNKYYVYNPTKHFYGIYTKNII